MIFLMSLYTFLWKYIAYDIIEMVNECTAPKCQTGYTSSTGKLSSFHVPLKNEDLNKKWIHFVNRKDWVPTKHSILCELHFEDIYKNTGKRMSLTWSMKPVATIYSAELIDTPSVLPITQTFRQPPRKRIFQEDQLDSFRIHGKINSIDDLNQSHSPPGFEFRQFEGCVIFYRLKFDNVSQFPTILESIRIDKDLHVQLQYNGIPLPLPSWFVNGHNAKLDKLSMLENFPPYIRSTAIENQQVLLDELKQRELYKPTGRPPISASMIRFALHLRHTSPQAYKLLLKKFPMLSISLLNKI